MLNQADLRQELDALGRRIISAFEKLEELDAFGVYQPDIVIYDVLGDVVLRWICHANQRRICQRCIHCIIR